MRAFSKGTQLVLYKLNNGSVENILSNHIFREGHICINLNVIIHTVPHNATWLCVPADHSGDMESNWGDLVEQAERPPGRAVHLHQRLSSPSRKRLAAQ